MTDKLSDETKKYIKLIADGKFKTEDYKNNPERMLDEFSKLLIDLGMLVESDDAATDQEEGTKSIQFREFLQTPEQFKYGTTKVENELMRPETSLVEVIDRGGFQADITSRKDKINGNSYKVPAYFTLPEGVTLPDNFDYTQTKRSIVNAIGNAYDLVDEELHIAGAKTIRVDHLINLMNGDNLTTDVRPEAVEELIKEIEPLTTVRVEIDASDHQVYNQSNRSKIQLEQNKFKGFLLPVEFQETKEFSKSKQVYMHILRRPVLYDYASNAGQLIKVNYQTLDLTKRYLEDGTEEKTIIKQMTQQRRAIRDYIIGQIYGRGRNYNYTKITYKSIYDVVENDLGKKPRKQTLDRNIENVVMALQQKDEIKKYEIIPKGRTKLHRIDIYHKKH